MNQRLFIASESVLDALTTFQKACNALIDASMEHGDREMTWAGINAQTVVLDVIHDRVKAAAAANKDGEAESCPAA